MSHRALGHSRRAGGVFQDPFGVQSGSATHKQDLSEAEITQRAAEWFATMGDCTE